MDDQYRYHSVDNVLMVTGDASGIGVFCTTVENSSRKFDTLFGPYSSYSTENKYDVPGLSELLAAKYEITKAPGDKKVVDSVTGRDATFYITEKDACPIGFSVDYALTEAEFMEIPQEQRALTLMQAAIVDEDKLPEVGNVTLRAESGNLEYGESIDSLIKKTVSNRVHEFHRDSHGFTCLTSYDDNRLLYFTVPWSEGWKATVDGVDTEVLNSGGMMALCISAGEHQVEFSYHTPGFHAGIMISIISWCVFIIFTLIKVKSKTK